MPSLLAKGSYSTGGLGSGCFGVVGDLENALEGSKSSSSMDTTDFWLVGRTFSTADVSNGSKSSSSSGPGSPVSNGSSGSASLGTTSSTNSVSKGSLTSSGFEFSEMNSSRQL